MEYRKLGRSGMYVSEIAYEPLPHFPVLSQR